jgi:hypothetical protein
LLVPSARALRDGLAPPRAADDVAGAAEDASGALLVARFAGNYRHRDVNRSSRSKGVALRQDIRIRRFRDGLPAT